jgi:hypothetical protein
MSSTVIFMSFLLNCFLSLNLINISDISETSIKPACDLFNISNDISFIFEKRPKLSMPNLNNVDCGLPLIISIKIVP